MYQIEKKCVAWISNNSLKDLRGAYQYFYENQEKDFDIVSKDTGQVYLTKKDSVIEFIDEDLFQRILLSADNECWW